MLDNAFDALRKFDWGTDLANVAPIEEAVTSTHDQPDARKDLEQRLVEILKAPLSRDAQDYVCRKLAIIGTSTCVPMLAELVLKKENSHMARFALEQISASEAAHALREAVTKVVGNTKVGVISSIGARRDAAAVATLTPLLADNDVAVTRAAALALGSIGSAESVAALQAAANSATSAKPAIIDALLACGEALIAANKKKDALAIYKSLANEPHGRLVRLAATRGMLVCAGK